MFNSKPVTMNIQDQKALRHFQDVFSEHNGEVYALMLEFDNDVNNSFEEFMRLFHEKGEPFAKEVYRIYQDSPILGRPEFLDEPMSNFDGGQHWGGFELDGDWKKGYENDGGGSKDSGGDAGKWISKGLEVAPAIIGAFTNKGGGQSDNQDESQPQPPQQTQKTGGGNTALYVGLGIFGVLVVGLIIVLATNK